MTAYRRSDIGLILEAKALTDGTATEILSGDNGGLTINEIRLFNSTGAAIVTTVDIYDGINAFYLMKSESIVSNTSNVISVVLPLLNGWSLRVTGATDLQVIVPHFRTTYRDAV